MEKLHRGWIILLLVALTMLACLGFGRFSFGAILPFMKEALAFDYRQAGQIGSSIFLGYLFSVALIGWFVLRFGARRVIVFSLYLTAAGMAIAGLANDFRLVYAGCLLIGAGTGGANVPALGLLSHWFVPAKKGMAMGLVMSGTGIGMVFSGFVVPRLVTLNQENGWRNSWFILASLVVAVALINWLFLKNRPDEIGLAPIGQSAASSAAEKKSAGMTVTQQAAIPEAQPARIQSSRQAEVQMAQPAAKPAAAEKLNLYQNRRLWGMGLIYFSWGFSYVIFSTFFVDYLIHDLNMVREPAGMLFSIVGFASIPSGLVWGTLSDRLGRMPALALVLLTQGCMLAGLSLTGNPGLIAVETAIYGSTLWGVPAIMSASIAEAVETKYFAVAMGFITIFFSLGQFISPFATGNIIEFTGQYFVAFLLSAFFCLLGGIGSLVLYRYHK